jgi:hypothetical protein
MLLSLRYVCVAAIGPQRRIRRLRRMKLNEYVKILHSSIGRSEYVCKVLRDDGVKKSIELEGKNIEFSMCVVVLIVCFYDHFFLFLPYY